jgi:hypothetical protein
MKTPSTVGSVKPTPQKMNDVSTPKSKRKIDLNAIVEEENDVYVVFYNNQSIVVGNHFYGFLFHCFQQ